MGRGADRQRVRDETDRSDGLPASTKRGNQTILLTGSTSKITSSHSTSSPSSPSPPAASSSPPQCPAGLLPRCAAAGSSAAEGRPPRAARGAGGGAGRGRGGGGGAEEGGVGAEEVLERPPCSLQRLRSGKPSGGGEREWSNRVVKHGQNGLKEGRRVL